VGLERRCLSAFSWRRYAPQHMGRVQADMKQSGAAGPKPAETPSNTFRRTLLFSLVALLGLGLGASEVLAHSRLVKSEPAARAVLAAAPKEVRLWFNEAIEIAFAKIWIVPASGPQIPLANHGDPSDSRLLIATLPDNLPNGPVVIGFRVLSVDGHVVESQLAFTINTPT
jgi:copper resistance protein C